LYAGCLQWFQHSSLLKCVSQPKITKKNSLKTPIFEAQGHSRSCIILDWNQALVTTTVSSAQSLPQSLICWLDCQCMWVSWHDTVRQLNLCSALSENSAELKTMVFSCKPRQTWNRNNTRLVCCFAQKPKEVDLYNVLNYESSNYNLEKSRANMANEKSTKTHTAFSGSMTVSSPINLHYTQQTINSRLSAIKSWWVSVTFIMFDQRFISVLLHPPNICQLSDLWLLFFQAIFLSLIHDMMLCGPRREQRRPISRSMSTSEISSEIIYIPKQRLAMVGKVKTDCSYCNDENDQQALILSLQEPIKCTWATKKDQGVCRQHW